MKTPLSEIEQANLKTRGVLANNEIAYKENNLTYAEDVLSGNKRLINVNSFMNESKNLLLG